MRRSRVEPQLRLNQVIAAAIQTADRKIVGAFVVACGDAAEVLQTAEHALDAISAAIGVAVVGVRVLAGRIGWNDGPGSPLGEPVA